MSDPFKNALAFLESIEAMVSEKHKKYFSRLKKPNNILKGQVKVKMDSGAVKSFTAFRSQHNDALGPYKGGIRFHENVTESEVKALSLWMSIKCSVAGIPFGGGKGGVVVNPKKLSESELENLSRAYARFISPIVGEKKDVPAPDVNTNPHIMALILDEYEKIIGFRAPGTFTGKPIEIGGSAGRTKATGFGGVLAMKFLLEKLSRRGLSPASAKASVGHAPLYLSKSEGRSGAGSRPVSLDFSWVNKPKSQITIAVQGFGNVGYYFARIASDMGFKVVAVSDSKGGVYVEKGLDPEATLKCKEEKGTLAGCYCVGGVCDLRGGRVISNEALLELPVDILVPAALENVIHEKNAGKIKAKIILEMANGPTTPEADEILTKKGVMIVPDVYANAGGVSVSYFEWAQNISGYYWEESEVDAKLEKLMKSAFEKIWQKYQTMGKNSSLRLSAYILAVERILEAERLRRP